MAKTFLHNISNFLSKSHFILSCSIAMWTPRSKKKGTFFPIKWALGESLLEIAHRSQARGDFCKNEFKFPCAHFNFCLEVGIDWWYLKIFKESSTLYYISYSMLYRVIVITNSVCSVLKWNLAPNHLLRLVKDFFVEGRECWDRVSL